MPNPLHCLANSPSFRHISPTPSARLAGIIEVDRRLCWTDMAIQFGLWILFCDAIYLEHSLVDSLPSHLKIFEHYHLFPVSDSQASSGIRRTTLPLPQQFRASNGTDNILNSVMVLNRFGFDPLQIIPIVDG